MLRWLLGLGSLLRHLPQRRGPLMASDGTVTVSVYVWWVWRVHVVDGWHRRPRASRRVPGSGTDGELIRAVHEHRPLPPTRPVTLPSMVPVPTRHAAASPLTPVSFDTLVSRGRFRLRSRAEGLRAAAQAWCRPYWVLVSVPARRRVGFVEPLRAPPASPPSNNHETNNRDGHLATSGQAGTSRFASFLFLE